MAYRESERVNGFYLEEPAFHRAVKKKNNDILDEAEQKIEMKRKRFTIAERVPQHKIPEKLIARTNPAARQQRRILWKQACNQTTKFTPSFW